MSKNKEVRTEETEKSPADAIKVETSFSQSAVDTEDESSAQGPVEVTIQTEEEKLRARVAELEDKHLRSMAELDNFRKRTARQFDDLMRSANDRLFDELFDVITNLDRALDHCKDGADIASLRQGMELIQSQFKGLLTRNDILPIEALGQPFDPKYHEALAHIDSAEYPENIVSAEIRKGYMQGDRVLRHSQVAVSRGPASDSKKGK
jgi:molecular chaperone GrpE